MATLHIDTLGGLALRLDDTAVTGLASRKAEALLVYLACEPRPHTRSVLATLLWDDHPQQRALANLSVLLSSLRKQLAPFLLINRQTVAINTSSPYQLDVNEFLKKTTAVAPQQTLTRNYAAQLTQAVTLYQGIFLAGFHLSRANGFEEWVFMEQERLHQIALQALSQLVEFHQTRQQFNQGIKHARRLVQFDPLREQSHRQLMRLLAHDGQRNAALEQYKACRQLLLEELGVETAVETTALYRQIKEGQFTRHEETSLLARVDQQLPIPGSVFVGREAELQLITQRLDAPDCRLLTLTGPGGSGKTRLALQVAHQRAGDFLHGVCFVPLAALESAAFLAETIADALNFLLSSNGTAAAQLLDFFREKELLLVLDNMEHVLAGVDFLAQILRQAPNVKLLVTSRERLQLREEWVLTLRGLSFPPTPVQDGKSFAAMDLFVQCARRVSPGFVIAAEEQAAIGHICRLVEGLPLGIELAASWVRLLSCQEIAAEIERSFGFLSSSMHDVPVRHRNLQVVFAHSWQLLTADEQQTLMRLSLFHDGFSRDAAAQVAGASLLTLAALVDKSFVRLEVEPLRRYSIHNMLHQFAQEKLTLQPAVAVEAQQQFCRFFTTFLEERLRPLQGGGQIKALQEIRVEIKNVRAALAWILNQRVVGEELKHLGMIALETLFLLYNMRSWFQEGYAVFDYAVDWVGQEQENEADTILLGWVLARKGWFAFLLDQRMEGERLLTDGLQMLRAADARQEMIFCLNYLGAIAHYQNDPQRARQLLDESLFLSREMNDAYGEAIALNIQGIVAQALQEYETAVHYFQASLTLKKQLGDLWGMAFSLNNLGNGAAILGQLDQAQQFYQQSLEIRRELGDKRGVATCLRDLGHLATLTNDDVAAQQFYEESTLILAEIGDMSGVNVK